MAAMSFVSRILGRGDLEGRVNALHHRDSPLVLPHCAECGFGIMRVQRPTDDPFETKLETGQTRLRCDRVSCSHVAVIRSFEPSHA